MLLVRLEELVDAGGGRLAITGTIGELRLNGGEAAVEARCNRSMLRPQVSCVGLDLGERCTHLGQLGRGRLSASAAREELANAVLNVTLNVIHVRVEELVDATFDV